MRTLTVRVRHIRFNRLRVDLLRGCHADAVEETIPGEAAGVLKCITAPCSTRR